MCKHFISDMIKHMFDNKVQRKRASPLTGYKLMIRIIRAAYIPSKHKKGKADPIGYHFDSQMFKILKSDLIMVGDL